MKVADIAAYQATDPDPYDLEEHPEASNPYGVFTMEDGSALVADTAGNDLLHVTWDGDVHTVARVKPRTVKVPRGLGEEAPPPGTPIPSEAVITSVTVGPDGYAYIGELRGFPARPRTSQIWRVRPEARNAVCDPERPHRGPENAVGSLVRISPDQTRRRELAEGRLVFPGDVALDRRGRVFVTAPVFGDGKVLRVR